MNMKPIISVIDVFCIIAVGVIPSVLTLPLSFYAISFPALVIIIIRVSKIYETKKEQKEKIRILVNTLYSFIIREVNTSDVRITYHEFKEERFWRRSKYKQLIDYCCIGGGAGREFDAQKGIVSKALTDKQIKFENFNNSEEYREKMIQEYNYEEDELGKRSIDRKSYLSHPIVDSSTNKVYGALYLDSSDINIFDSENEKVNNIVKQIARAIHAVIK